MKYLSILFLVIYVSCNTFTDVKIPIKPLVPLADLLDSLQIQKSEISVLIHKRSYTLEVLTDNETLRTYPCVLGGNPEDQKLMEGDKCTPEGTFKVRNLYPHSRWSKFIWFDYPNEQSIENHLLAKQNGDIPSGSTIGGEVGIHGVPEGMDHWISERNNWTLGCVSLTTNDINDLYPVLQKGTKVVIQK